jgi:acyl CoA:acetate/3-ketoacid CoA transferase
VKGTFTAGNLVVAGEDGKLRILQERRARKVLTWFLVSP